MNDDSPGFSPQMPKQVPPARGLTNDDLVRVVAAARTDLNRIRLELLAHDAMRSNDHLLAAEDHLGTAVFELNQVVEAYNRLAKTA